MTDITEKESLKKATLHLQIPFPTAREANIAYNALQVDAEPKRSQVIKGLKLEDKSLILDLTAPDTRQIRLTVNTFLDRVHLVQKTIAKFSEPDSD